MVAGLAVARAGVRKPASLLHCTALQPKVAAGFMEKINASVEARCSACRDRKEKRATCGWHGMAAGEYGGGCGCLPPPRQAAGAGAYLEAAEWRA